MRRWLLLLALLLASCTPTSLAGSATAPPTSPSTDRRATAQAEAVNATVTAIARQASQELTATAFARITPAIPPTPVPVPRPPYVPENVVPRGARGVAAGLSLQILGYNAEATRAVQALSPFPLLPNHHVVTVTLRIELLPDENLGGQPPLLDLYEEDFWLLTTENRPLGFPEHTCGSRDRRQVADLHSGRPVVTSLCFQVPDGQATPYLVFDPIGREARNRRYLAL